MRGREPRNAVEDLALRGRNPERFTDDCPDISWFVVSATENLRSLVVADEGGGLKLRRARGSLLSYLIYNNYLVSH